MVSAPDLVNVNHTSQTSFDSNHKLYDAARPGYAQDVVSFAVELSHGNPTLEIAAGTGKFSVSLVKHIGAENLTAVDPSSGMLESFHENLPDVKCVQASADKLPFADNSFNTVYIAQAFHWFATRSALTEIHRVLKPEGRLILVWNYEDIENLDPSKWQYQSVKLIQNYDGDVPQYRRGDWEKALNESGDIFRAPFSSKKFHRELPLPSVQHYWDNWESRSYISALSESERESLKKKYFSILDQHEGPLVAKVGTHVVWVTAI